MGKLRKAKGLLVEGLGRHVVAKALREAPRLGLEGVLPASVVAGRVRNGGTSVQMVQRFLRPTGLNSHQCQIVVREADTAAVARGLERLSRFQELGPCLVKSLKWVFATIRAPAL